MSPNTHPPETVWRAAGGGPTRSGAFTGRVTVPGKPIRRLPAHGAVLNSVIFNDQGTVFIADMAGAIQAYSAEGRLQWETRLEAGVQASPALDLDGEVLFVGTLGGSVHALKASSGKAVWRRELSTKSDPRILSDLLCDPGTGTVILSSWGGRFHALETATGKPRFEVDAGFSPAAAAATDPEGNLYLLRAVAKQGTELVRVAPGGKETLLHCEPETNRGARRALVAAAPVLDLARQTGHAVINRDGKAQLISWSLNTGQVVHNTGLPHAVQGTPTLLPDGSVAVADLGGEIHSVTPGGTARFKAGSGTEYLLAGPVTEAGGTIVYGDPLGLLHLVDPGGRDDRLFEAERAIQGRCSFAPDGALHVPCADRQVYVFAGRRES
jgi:outer membrane protein assembly factor BamB